MEAVRRVFAPHLGKGGAGEETPFWKSWRATLRLLRPLGAVSLGNRVEVLSDGDVVVERMWAAIEGARERVLMDTYILRADRVGERTLAALADAAARGVKVGLSLDAYGSSELFERESPALRRLRANGGMVQAFNPPFRAFPLVARLSRLVRNHRKILVVDDRVAFCGGMNCSEDYAGERHGNGRFRDTHLVLEGPCASDLAVLCERLLGIERRRRGEDDEAGGTLVQVLESNVRRQRRAIQKALRWTVARAQERCYLTSPYFVPPARLVRQMVRAAQRGVDVRVLTAGTSDVPAVYLASQHLYGRLLKKGVRIFEMRGQILHSKTIAIDGVYASVGSFNLDRWSYRRNLEVTASMLDTDTTAKVEADFHRDVERSVEVTLENWRRRTLWQKVLHWGAYVLMRI